MNAAPELVEADNLSGEAADAIPPAEETEPTGEPAPE
jgi:hypothetical protein